MAEDEETATARYIASNVSTQLMLKTMFEIITAMADDPDGYRSDIRTKLLEVADTMPLAPMVAAREGKVRAFVKETVGNLLINQRLNSAAGAAVLKILACYRPNARDGSRHRRTANSAIEGALDKLISREEGTRFQALTVILAKQKWAGSDCVGAA